MGGLRSLPVYQVWTGYSYVYRVGCVNKDLSVCWTDWVNLFWFRKTIYMTFILYKEDYPNDTTTVSDEGYIRVTTTTTENSGKPSQTDSFTVVSLFVSSFSLSLKSHQYKLRDLGRYGLTSPWGSKRSIQWVI